MSEALFGPGEFSRIVDVRAIDERPHVLVASPEECARLAARFDLVAVHRLEARLSLVRDGAAVDATGEMVADYVQSCAISAADMKIHRSTPVALRFIPESAGERSEEEIEIDSASLDEIEYDGVRFDLGEAVAQTFALSIDPFAAGPEADAVRQAVGLGDERGTGPFAALAGLRTPGQTRE